MSAPEDNPTAGGDPTVAVDPAIFINLTQAIQDLKATLAAPSTTTSTAIYDLFDNSNPYNLATRTGMEAMNQASQALKMDGIDKWDGDVNYFPNFLLALKDRFKECNWDATDASGIRKISIDIPGATPSDPVTTIQKDILEDYHSITMPQIENAFNKITNNRAKQNHKALFKTAKDSITGDIKTTTFDIPENQPQQWNGWAIIKSFAEATSVASLTVAIKASSKLLDFDPSVHSYNIPNINKELNRLFILATTPQRSFSQMERIQVTITTYDRMKQPYEWTLWVKEVKRDFKKNQLKNCQDLMNEAVTAYNTVKEESSDNKFSGSLKTQHEEIVAMFTEKLKQTIKRKAIRSPRDGDDENKPPKKTGPCPFIKHTHVDDDPNGREYKLGDTKQWKDKTYYYCPTKTHKNGLRWHKHHPDECTVRKRFLEENPEVNPSANVADVPKEEEANAVLVDAEAATPADAKADTDVRLHHFRHHVVKKTITIEHVDTHNQLADTFTKPLARDQFILLRDRIMTRQIKSSSSSIQDIENQNPNLINITSRKPRIAHEGVFKKTDMLR